MADVRAEILGLVRDALDELDSSKQLTSVIRKAIRVARLRSDHEALWWLQLELVSINDDNALTRLKIELASHVGKDRFRKLVTKSVELWNEARKVRLVTEPPRSGKARDIKASTTQSTVPEIERQIQLLDER